MRSQIHIALTVLTLVSLSGIAQQDAMFSQYLFNPQSLNPAYAGSRESMHIGAIAREQWVGVKGRPRTQSIFIHSPLKRKDIALGFTALRDEAGPLINTQFAFDGAYRIQVGLNSKISFALRASTNMYNGLLSTLEHTSASDIVFQQDVNYAFNPNFGAGVYWYSPRHYLGLGAPKILSNGLNPQDSEVGAYMENTHLFAMAGLVLGAHKKGIKVKPNAMVKYVPGVPMQIDVGASILLMEKLWLGGVYRLDTDFAAIMALQINPQLRLGYSYDYNLGSISQFSDGSHEFTLSYDFIFKKTNYMSPRYF